MLATETTRHRMIITEGDGQAVYRHALNYQATATVYVGPSTGPRRPDTVDSPSVALIVDGDGGWRVQTQAALAAHYTTPVVIATGNIDDLPCEGAFRFTRHTTASGDGCRWSGVSVKNPIDRAVFDDRRCPARCPASDVEIDPTGGDEAPDDKPAPTGPAAVLAAMPTARKLALLSRVFDTLENDEDGNPGSEWSSDTAQALGELFEKFGITFTPPTN
jgi:hypothetical protein